MEKPEGFTRTIARSEWPQEWIDWERYRRIIADHPEWKDLSDEEFRKAHDAFIQESRRKAIEKAKATVAAMDPQKRAEINKKKGSFYNNMTPEQKLKQNEVLRQRSNSFWQGMNDEERHEFGRYRESLVPEDVKQARNKRFLEGAKRHRESLTKEDIDAQIARMNAARQIKLDTDPVFREEQFRLLRLHCEEYWDSLTESECREMWHNNGTKASKSFIAHMERDPEFRDKMIQHLRQHCRDYVDSLTPDELREHADMLNHHLHDFYDSMSPEERNEILHNNKLNERFERRFKESSISKKFYYVKEFLVKIDNMNFKFWDYGIYNMNNNLVAVVDLDGSYYHADECDYDGLHSKEERDCKRGNYIPENTKCFIITSSRFIEGFAKMIQEIPIDYESYIQNIFNEMKCQPFPYPHYNITELMKSYDQLRKMKCDDKYHRDISLNTRIGDRLIQHFHRSIWHAHSGNKPSPYDIRYDDELLMKCIRDRTIHQNHLNPNKILQGFNISKIATRVSVFSAGRVKMIISRYLNEFATIFDPFSGFSGRMLGAISLDKKYVGQDINEITVRESNQLIDFLQGYYDFDATVTQQDILPSSGSYPCLFTCPPYSDKEQWNGTPVDKRSCDDWIDICLKQFKCKRYVFVVDNTTKYAQYVVDEIKNKYRLSNSSEYVVCIDRED